MRLVASGSGEESAPAPGGQQVGEWWRWERWAAPRQTLSQEVFEGSSTAPPELFCHSDTWIAAVDVAVDVARVPALSQRQHMGGMNLAALQLRAFRQRLSPLPSPGTPRGDFAPCPHAGCWFGCFVPGCRQCIQADLVPQHSGSVLALGLAASHTWCSGEAGEPPLSSSWLCQAGCGHPTTSHPIWFLPAGAYTQQEEGSELCFGHCHLSPPPSGRIHACHGDTQHAAWGGRCVGGTPLPVLSLCSRCVQTLFLIVVVAALLCLCAPLLL